MLSGGYCTHRLIRHIASYYAKNPQDAVSHGSGLFNAARTHGPTVLKHTAKLGGKTAVYLGKSALKHGPTVLKGTAKLGGKAAVHISKMVWLHGGTAAKHSAKFMVKAALKTFKFKS